MITSNPYLHFSGNAREALDFYKTIFNGEVSGLQSYAEAGMAHDESMKNRVMHSEFKAGGVYFMASDSPTDVAPHSDNNISMSLNFSDTAEIDRVFNALAQGGTVTVPLDTAPWGAKFGMLTDKYGIEWLLNCYVQ
jgi:PhnB protein